MIKGPFTYYVTQEGVGGISTSVTKRDEGVEGFVDLCDVTIEISYYQRIFNIYHIK